MSWGCLKSLIPNVVRPFKPLGARRVVAKARINPRTTDFLDSPDINLKIKRSNH